MRTNAPLAAGLPCSRAESRKRCDNAKITQAKIKYARKLLGVCERSMKATRRNLRKVLQEARDEDVPSWNGIQDSSSPSGGRDLELTSPPSPTLSDRSYASSWNGIEDHLSSSSSQMETSDEEYDPRHPEYIFPVTQHSIAGPDSPASSVSSYSSMASWNSLQDAVPSDEATTRQEAAPRVQREDIIAAVDPDGFHFLHSFEDESATDYSQMHTSAEAHVDADGFHFLVFGPKRRGSSSV
ncbi:hypothetical protein BDZ89DRAFT_1038701 [Hymenopellis radicata]|nr:hypothetical protein BDZ89DRAFT_1038701 [Hymenopellis radicata]